MAKTSWAGRVVDIDDNSFKKWHGVNAAEAFLLRNNLAHAIDESTQPRISWSSQNGATYGVHYYMITGAAGARYCEKFPLSWLAPDKPANLYVSTVFKVNTSGGADYSYRLTIVPDNTPVGQGNSQAVLDISGTETDNVETALESSVTGVDYFQQLRTAWKPIGATDDEGVFRGVSLCMLRLEIEFTSTASESSVEVLALDVMEYA